MMTAPQKHTLYLCLHGWGQSALTFDAFIEALPAHVDGVAIDLPGYGQYVQQTQWILANPQESFEASVTQLYENITQLIMSYQCVHIVGWSLGGLFALQLSQKVRQVESVTLIGTNVQFVKAAHYTAAMDNDIFEAFVSSCQLSESKTLKRFNMLQAGGESESRTWVKYLSSLTVNAGRGVLQAGLQTLKSMSMLPLLSNLPDIKINIVLGENDPLIPVVDVLVSIPSLIGGVQSVNTYQVERCGHLLHISVPHRLISILFPIDCANV